MDDRWADIWLDDDTARRRARIRPAPGLGHDRPPGRSWPEAQRFELAGSWPPRYQAANPARHVWPPGMRPADDRGRPGHVGWDQANALARNAHQATNAVRMAAPARPATSAQDLVRMRARWTRPRNPRAVHNSGRRRLVYEIPRPRARWRRPPVILHDLATDPGRPRWLQILAGLAVIGILAAAMLLALALA